MKTAPLPRDRGRPVRCPATIGAAVGQISDIPTAVHHGAWGATPAHENPLPAPTSGFSRPLVPSIRIHPEVLFMPVGGLYWLILAGTDDADEHCLSVSSVLSAPSVFHPIVYRRSANPYSRRHTSRLIMTTTTAMSTVPASRSGNRPAAAASAICAPNPVVL